MRKRRFLSKLLVVVLLTILVLVAGVMLYMKNLVPKDFQVDDLGKNYSGMRYYGTHLSEGAGKERVECMISQEVFEEVVTSKRDRIYKVEMVGGESNENYYLSSDSSTSVKEVVKSAMMEHDLWDDSYTVMETELDDYIGTLSSELSDITLQDLFLPVVDDRPYMQEQGWRNLDIKQTFRGKLVLGGSDSFPHFDKMGSVSVYPDNKLTFWIYTVKSVKSYIKASLLDYDQVVQNLINKKFRPVWVEGDGSMYEDQWSYRPGLEMEVLVVSKIDLAYYFIDEYLQPVYLLCGSYTGEGGRKWCGLMPAVDYDKLPEGVVR